MRVMCTVAAAPSHVRNVLPVARALGAAGHDVLVVTPEALLPMWKGQPVRAMAGLTNPAESMPRLTKEILGLPSDTDPEAFQETVSLTLVGGPHISEHYGSLLAVARDFKPQLILRDGWEPTACLVGEALGIPHVSAPSGSGQVLNPTALMAVLNRRRAEVGLPAVDDPNAIYRYGRLDCVPSRYSFARRGIPAAFAYRQPGADGRGESLPAWLAELPADQPLVMAALGGAAARFAMFLSEYGSALKKAHPALADFDPSGALQSIVDGLSQTGHVAVVATGGIPVDRTSVGPNVHVVDYLPQPMVLECADLFVTHGGYNSIREAIRAGVPMAVLPLFEDQFPNAARVEELGLGARIAQPKAAHVADTCKRLLADPGVAAEARRAQRHMLALPLVNAAVRHLERIAQQSP